MPIKVDVPNYENLVAGAFDEALIKITTRIEAEAKQNSPVDTGLYRNKIVIEGKNMVVASVNYSQAVEYGFEPGFQTKTFTYKFGRRPNPVMRNAARKVQKEVAPIFSEIINR